jgi:hypothetical protein
MSKRRPKTIKSGFASSQRGVHPLANVEPTAGSPDDLDDPPIDFSDIPEQDFSAPDVIRGRYRDLAL